MLIYLNYSHISMCYPFYDLFKYYIDISYSYIILYIILCYLYIYNINICVYIYIYMCIYIYVYISTYPSFYHWTCPCPCLCLSACFCLFWPMCPSTIVNVALPWGKPRGDGRERVQARGGVIHCPIQWSLKHHENKSAYAMWPLQASPGLPKSRTKYAWRKPQVNSATLT